MKNECLIFGGYVPGEKLTWDDVNVRGQNLFLLGE